MGHLTSPRFGRLRPFGAALGTALLLVLLIHVLGVQTFAESLKPERIEQEGLSRGLDHLLEVSRTGERIRLDPSLVRPVLTFVASKKASETLYHVGERDGATSAYNEFDIARGLGSVLQYAYNPDIPANVFRPSSIRLSRWLQVDGGREPIPRLWERLSGLDSPVVVTGVEYEENTPEPATGACYGYTMDRGLILFRDQGRNAFVSVSRQRDASDTGEKGACLGDDRSWDYVYTGEEGLTRSGLGWADTRIYSAASIAVYYELDQDPPTVRCGVFKWIRAGWAGLNLVEKKHIHAGMERFAQGFQTAIHHPRLPEPDRLARMFEWVRSMPEGAIKAKVNDYLRGLRSRYEGEKVLSKGSFEKLLKAGDYASRMTREQMESLLSLEYLKWILGMNTVLGEAFRVAPGTRGERLSSTSRVPPG